MELRAVDAPAFDFQALCFGLCARSRTRDQFPTFRRPFDLTAVTFHYLKFIRQTMKNRVVGDLPHRVQATFEDAGGVVATWFFASVPDMGIDRRQGMLRIAAMRTIPRLVHTHRCQDRQCLRSATRGPERQVTPFQDSFSSAPRLPLDLAKVFEIPRQKGAKRPRFRFAESLIKTANPDLLGLEASPPGAGFCEGDKFLAVVRQPRIVSGVHRNNPVRK